MDPLISGTGFIMMLAGVYMLILSNKPASSKKYFRAALASTLIAAICAFLIGARPNSYMYYIWIALGSMNFIGALLGFIVAKQCANHEKQNSPR